MSRTVDEDDPLTDEIKECNAFNPDLAVDVHNNAGGGDGFEAYCHYKGGTSKILAENIEAEIIKIGQNSRGCKVKTNSAGKDYFGFIRQTAAPAVIVEGVFVDNATDVQIADTIDKQKEFGKAYARGILKTLGISVKEQSASTETSNLSNATYYVQVGAYSQKENAEAQLEKAKAAGFSDAFIKTF
ncbi:MAG: Sporulation-specific N-acetylmuramoyl-L-alanine amidase [Eubacteriales bacterium SKADARSKE-1]|nr:Sporulation-specific N-acetylmuramoyl-L-alanine amidase [Eubacteriales bacterium SKADARSKE-1]